MHACLQLALVHMSDHYTRITTGGSPLPPDTPVVGILFGKPPPPDKDKTTGTTSTTSTTTTLAVVDAEDIPLDDPAPAVALHLAVFGQHAVVGSYRVTADLQQAQPTAVDLQQALTLHKAHPETAVYFGLLQVQQQPPEASEKEASQKTKKKNDKSLPLQLFLLQGSVLIAVADWHLASAAVAERIAVERVLRDQPTEAQQNNERVQAWQALDTRLEELMQALERTMSSQPTSTPPSLSHLTLWRNVQSLLLQAHLLQGTNTTSGGPPNLLQVAVLAKTVDAIAHLTDKFRWVHETKTSGASTLRDVRRF
jgi:hypothetical protein